MSSQRVAPIAQPAPSKTRVALWDNARFILIVLVVMGHAVSTIRMESSFGFGVYTYIYLFHMPAMILLSGVFSKPETSPKAVRSTVQLLVVWGIWEGIWALLEFFVEGSALPKSFLVSPGWSLWFLLTLATMRILLPYIAQLRRPLLFSVVLALVAGISPAIGADFSASRTLCFLPFFVAGWLAKDRGWFSGAWFLRPTPTMRGVAWGLLAVIALVFVLLPQLREEWRLDSWLRWRDDYGLLFDKAPIGSFAPDELWAVVLVGAGVRLLLLAFAAAMTLALLLITSRGASIITVWGARTLYVYLLHGVIIWVARETGVVDWFGSFGIGGVLALLALSIPLTVLLSMGWVVTVFRPILEPRIDRLFSGTR